eukprot:scaffold3226_cov160-Amphora_coffeaeformis.AAC.24
MDLLQPLLFPTYRPDDRDDSQNYDPVQNARKAICKDRLPSRTPSQHYKKQALKPCPQQRPTEKYEQ